MIGDALTAVMGMKPLLSTNGSGTGLWRTFELTVNQCGLVSFAAFFCFGWHSTRFASWNVRPNHRENNHSDQPLPVHRNERTPSTTKKSFSTSCLMGCRVQMILHSMLAFLRLNLHLGRLAERFLES
jgi:hypothetical protein